MKSTAHQLVRILSAGLHDIEEWRLGNPALAAAKGYPRLFAAPLLDDWGTLFIDIALDIQTGWPVCHEVNGPNAVGSDALTGDSSMRAELEARQAARRALEMGFLDRNGRLNQPVATLHAHQHWPYFRTAGEFYPRVDQFAHYLDAIIPGNHLALAGAGDQLGGNDLAVVMGDVPGIAARLHLDDQGRHFCYQGRPVIFIGNPNLLPELARLGQVRVQPARVPGDCLRVFHAWRLVHLIHDKARQQLFWEGTGVRPLRHFEAARLEEGLAQARNLLRHGPVVLKPNGASGGAGVHVVTPAMTDREIQARCRQVLVDCQEKYGPHAEAFALPLRGFEFVQSTGFPLADGDHLWDLRIAVLFEPGRMHLFPVSLRYAPAPFDAKTFHLNRDQWISNVSGRRHTGLISGLDDVALARVGLTEAKLETLFQACASWTMKAWDASIRDGGPGGAVHEDQCEAEDANFYPWAKFSP